MSQKRAKAIRKLVRSVLTEKGGPVVERNTTATRIKRYVDKDRKPIVVNDKQYETYTAVQQPGTVRSAIRLIKRAEKQFNATR